MNKVGTCRMDACGSG